MKLHRHTTEQIARKPREGDRLLNDGKDLAEVLRTAQVVIEAWRGAGQRRAEVQVADLLVDVEVHDHGGAMAVGSEVGGGVEAVLGHAHQRVGQGGERPGRLTVVAFALPVGDQRVEVGVQGGVDHRSVELG